MKNDQKDQDKDQLNQALLNDAKINEIIEFENKEQQLTELQKIIINLPS